MRAGWPDRRQSLSSESLFGDKTNIPPEGYRPGSILVGLSDCSDAAGLMIIPRIFLIMLAHREVRHRVVQADGSATDVPGRMQG